MRCWYLSHVQQQGSGKGIYCLHKQSMDACADPEIFVRGGPKFFMALRWRADDGPTLNAGSIGSFVIFQGMWIRIAKKPYCDFSGEGGPDPQSPLWICTWSEDYDSDKNVDLYPHCNH